MIWGRLPVTLRAVLLGLAVAIAGSIPWAVLASLNAKVWPAIPWAVPLMGAYLWAYWRYVQGAGWPRSTSEARRVLARVNGLSTQVWAMALVAGVAGLASVVVLSRIMGRVIALPVERAGDVSRLPVFSLILGLLMASIVAGVTEEVAFRGYLQGPIERRHGPAIAIVIAGVLFGLAHFTHPYATLALMPYFIAVAAVYGTLAYLTKSILPGLVLHAGGNMIGYVQLLLLGRSEWQTSAKPPPLIWVSGVDASFLRTCGVAAVLAAVASVAYAYLARIVRSDSSSSGAAGPGPLSSGFDGSE